MSYDVNKGRRTYLGNLVPMALSSYSPPSRELWEQGCHSNSLPLIIFCDLHKHTPPYPKLPKVHARKAKKKLIIKKIYATESLSIY